MALGLITPLVAGAGCLPLGSKGELGYACAKGWLVGVPGLCAGCAFASGVTGLGAAGAAGAAFDAGPGAGAAGSVLVAGAAAPLPE